MKEAVDDIMVTLNEAASEVGMVGGMVESIAEAMTKVGAAGKNWLMHVRLMCEVHYKLFHVPKPCFCWTPNFPTPHSTHPVQPHKDACLQAPIRFQIKALFLHLTTF